MKHPLAFWLLAFPSALANPLAAQQGRTATTCDELEQSNWFAGVSAELERAEYRFSAAQGRDAVWSAPNRAHDFRSRVSTRGIEVFPRSADVCDAGAQWKLVLATTSFGRAGNASELNLATLQVTNERVELDHGRLTEWFVNDERGLEHGWTIGSAPFGIELLWIGLEIGGDLCLRIDAGGRSGVFVDTTGEPRLRYTGLMAFDATGRELEAHLAPSPEGIGIAIDDVGAVYPLTVDPVLTGPAWTAESDQDGAAFGVSVATAGDVNGDGYSDVIVGASGYDNGQTQEGRTFLYVGSSAGLGTTAVWTAESDQSPASFGHSVATAGDVNGDGYSDVIVGAPLYSGGEGFEGRASVYLGASAGLPTTPDWTTESNQAQAQFGFSVATAGDVNGDGYSDVIVGSIVYDNGHAEEGRAFMYLGSSSGLATSAAWTAESDQSNAQFGFSVAPAGDVNGDGYSDVIVGAYLYSNGQSEEGRAFLYLGSGAGLSTTAAWTAESDQAGARFGHSVATAGDVNGDGYSDVIVGSGSYDNGQTAEGRAFLYLGSGSGLSTSSAWTAESDQPFAFYGWSVATAGDVNGDGYSDVIVGAALYDNGQTEEGRAFLYLGASAGLSTSAAWTAEGDQAGAQFGYPVATAGDVNGDGYSDVIVGSAGYSNGQTNEGRAFLYPGAAAGLSTDANWVADGDQTAAAFGFSVATAGDVNGDGYSDVIVGAYTDDNGQENEGRAFVYLGTSSGLSTNAAWTAESDQANANLGWSVATAGDVNGDGYSDVIVGAEGYSNGQTSEGRAFVYLGSGAGLSTSAAWTAESDQAGALFGFSIGTAGDVNGDGYSDVIVGALNYDNGQTNEGRAFLYLGSSSGLGASAAWTGEGDLDSASFGKSVATAGDVNADGYSDVVVGARSYNNGQTYAGGAFLYLGSIAGLSTIAAWTAESHPLVGVGGYSVATAGDVNGDGYSDVIIGAAGYADGQAGEGGAFLYVGTPAGLSTSRAWTAESNHANAQFGFSVAAAGDVNGDGFSDVVVGAIQYSGSQPNEGRAFVFLGSSSGLGTTAAWTAESGEAGALFARSVATAGDVNGDGYSDVIVGAHVYGHAAVGRAFLYLGNAGRGGWTLAPRQRRANDAAPIGLLGRSSNKTEFRLCLDFERELAGFAWSSGLTPKARLEWELAPLRAPLDGSGIESGVDHAITGAPLSFNELVEFQSGAAIALPFGVASRVAAGAYHWRARLRTNNPLLPVTTWVTIPWNNVTETKLRVGPAPAARSPH